jgi:ribosomal-protein-alanine N-acetyltransferase
MQILTLRLDLRLWTMDDANEAFELYRDPLVSKYLGKPDTDISQTQTRIQKFVDHQKQYGYSPMVVTEEESGKLIGVCGFHHFGTAAGNSGKPELGFRFAQSYWGKGYATEAASACLDYGFSKRKFAEVIGLSHRENAAGRKVFEKLGMKLVAEKTEWENFVQYGLSK